MLFLSDGPTCAAAHFKRDWHWLLKSMYLLSLVSLLLVWVDSYGHRLGGSVGTPHRFSQCLNWLTYLLQCMKLTFCGNQGPTGTSKTVDLISRLDLKKPCIELNTSDIRFRLKLRPFEVLKKGLSPLKIWKVESFKEWKFLETPIKWVYLDFTHYTTHSRLYGKSIFNTFSNCFT